MKAHINPALQKNTASHFLEYKGDVDIFVPLKKEEKYLSKHGIKIFKLDNGSTLVGATRKLDDIASSFINFYFPSGAYNEPKEKSGINHVLEHIFANKSGFLARKAESYFNATTNCNSLFIEMEGVTNPKVKNYGVWPVLDNFLKDMINFPRFSSKELENEKSVIYGEMHQREADNITVSSRLFNSIVFDKNNPINYEATGTRESVYGISGKDVIKRYKDLIIPNGLIASAFIEGSPSTTSEILTLLKRSLVQMPGKEKRPERINHNLENMVNPKFKQGEHFISNTNLNNKLMHTYYAWIVDSISYTVSTFARTRLLEVINRRLFEFVRESGIGYQAETFTLGYNEKLAVGLWIVIPKKDNPLSYAAALYKEILNKVFNSISNKDIPYIEDITQRRIKATPITAYNRFLWTLSGIRDYGKIIDNEKIIKLHQMITPKHLKNALLEFTSVKPSIAVIGDLS